MVANNGSRPFVVHEVTRAPTSETRSTHGFELRMVGLSAAADLLRMQIVGVDALRAACGVADLQPIPVCTPRPPVIASPIPAA
jgi:hypothetical protein